MPRGAEGPSASSGLGDSQSLHARPRSSIRAILTPGWPLGVPSGIALGLSIGLFLLAAVLRCGRALLRWEEVSLAYSAYQAPLVKALGDPGLLIDSWVGLHPPLYGLCYAIMERTAPLPLLFLGFSALCSFLAVFFVYRAARMMEGPVAALCALGLAATAPVALHYAAEINNYPLLLALVSALLWAWARYRSGRGGWLPVALLGVAAGWTHLLGGMVGGVVVLGVLWRHRGDGIKAFVLLALGCAPVVAGALDLAINADTYGQPELHLDLSVRDWRERFGWLCLPAAAMAIPALRRAPLLAVSWVGLLGSIAAMVALGVAAPHQFPYWSVLMPAGAVLVGVAAARVPGLWIGVASLVVLQGWLALRAEHHDLSRIWNDQRRARAVDLALAEARAGDGLWMISPALEPDDDKRAISPALWRLRPWRAMPMVEPFAMEYTDYRYGQPRSYEGLTVYSFTDYWPDRMDAILKHHTDSGHRVFVALYDHGPAQGYPERMRRLLRPWAFEERSVGTDDGLGVDRLVVITGRADSQASP